MESLLLFILDVITIILGIIILAVAATVLYTIYKGGGRAEIEENLRKLKEFGLTLLQRGEKVAVRSGELTKITANIIALKKERKDKLVHLGEVIVSASKKIELPEDIKSIVAEISTLDKNIKKLEKKQKELSDKILSEE